MKLWHRDNIQYAAYLLFKLPFVLAIFCFTILPCCVLLAALLAYSGVELETMDEDY